MRVSICIPTYNSAHLIGLALKGALAQLFGDFDILVSDNASTDGTREVVSGFHDSRISYQRHPENIGYTRNVRSCIERAREDFVVILCADDYWTGEFLGRIVETLRNRDGITLAYSAYERHLMDPDGERWIQTRRELRPAFCLGVSYVRDEFQRPFTILSACLFRRRAALEAGSFMDGSLRFLPDFMHRLRVAARGDVAYVDVPLVAYVEHPQSITSSHRTSEWILEERRVFEELVADPTLSRAGLLDLYRSRSRGRWLGSLKRLCELRGGQAGTEELVGFARNSLDLSGIRALRPISRLGALLLAASPPKLWRRLLRAFDNRSSKRGTLQWRRVAGRTTNP